MTEKHVKRLRLVYYILITAALIAAGICLIVACVGIYRSGDHPFSREIVAAAFEGIALPVILCLGLIVTGFVLKLLLPAKKKPAAPDRDLPTLRRLHAKTDLSGCDPTLTAAIQAEQRRRRLYRGVTLALLLVGSAVFLVYALNLDHFHQSEINASMIRAMWVLLPCMAVPFGFGVFAAYSGKRSVRREIALLKEAAGAAPKATPASATQPRRWLTAVRCVLLAAGVALLVAGILGDGFMDVLTKAINICTECIGLG